MNSGRSYWRLFTSSALTLGIKATEASQQAYWFCPTRHSTPLGS